jgi:carboxymethylenebutenolidase
MTLKHVNIRSADGVIDSVMIRPETAGELPGVILLTDIFGYRQAYGDMAAEIADRGYVVLIPNIFYRSAKPPIFDFEVDFGTERTMNRFKEITGPLRPDAMERDAAAFVDFLAEQPNVNSGPMGVVGFCFSGKFALRIASTRPDRIGAAASFHGAGLVTETEDSPHLLLPNIKAHLYFGHAENDRGMPVEAIAKLDEALETWGGTFTSEIYKGAAHGWMIKGREVHHPEQATRGFAKLMALLDDSLRSPTSTK